MGLRRIKTSEEGFLLLENLVTLSIIVTILIVLYPLLVDWLVLRENEIEKVEQARTLYETSMNWPEMKQEHLNKSYNIQSTSNSLTITGNKQKMGVSIYEVHFE